LALNGRKGKTGTGLTQAKGLRKILASGQSHVQKSHVFWGLAAWNDKNFEKAKNATDRAGKLKIFWGSQGICSHHSLARRVFSSFKKRIQFHSPRK